MKIWVKDLDAIQVKIKDLGSELERITIQVLRPTLNKFPARKIPVKFESSAEVAAPADAKQVEINLSLPHFPKLHPLKAIKRLKTVRRRYLLSAVVMCAALIAIGVMIALHHSNTPASSVNKTITLQKGNPSYATLVPGGKNIAALGGWTRISPPDRNPVYAYVDNIGGVQIDVSEQPLPANFKSDTATQVAQLAVGYNATDKFEAGGTTVYVGTAATGPQSVIFAKSDLLILIKSTSPLTNNQWAAYISTLQ